MERKNRTLQEVVLFMLNEYLLRNYFCTKAISVPCHVQSRLYLHRILVKTPYEFWYGKTQLNISGYLRVFSCILYMLNTKNHLGNFLTKEDKGILVAYTLTGRVYYVYNK